ncbi:MAG: type II toxin-antitoxin system HicA family toxin [Kiritimatiellaeota bacterium]|nr:type II toxin-antitoxin system HicA family toxin [Kiritimatiellota bacterium]
MKMPRDMSGNDMVKRLCKSWGYSVVHCVGSHVVLQTETPSRQRIVVPNHPVLKIGTLNNILRSVATHKQTVRELILAEKEV